MSNLLGVTPSLPASSVAELIALCRNEPGKYAFASSGPGTSLHLSGELFKAMAGVDIIHVPYKGAGPAYTDLISGTVQMMFANMPSMLPQVRGGKIKGLGVTSAGRSKVAPDITAIAETIPGYVATSWYGVGAPAGTPEPDRQRRRRRSQGSCVCRSRRQDGPDRRQGRTDRHQGRREAAERLNSSAPVVSTAAVETTGR